MKYRDPKTGKLYTTIGRAWVAWNCPKPGCQGKIKSDCEFSKTVCCVEWCNEHPAEAARMMGYEVVEDEDETPYECQRTPTHEATRQSSVATLDWDRIAGGIAVWCKTEEEATILLREGKERGFYWYSGAALTEYTNWVCYKASTVYSDFDGSGVVYNHKDRTRRPVVPFSELLIVEKEEAMEENKKPLSQWTLGEVVQECREANGCCAICRFYEECKECLFGSGIPRRWDLEETPRWTESELVVLRYIDDCQKIKEVRRTKNGILEILFETEGLWAFPADMFQTLAPGQKALLSDIIGGDAHA